MTIAPPNLSDQPWLTAEPVRRVFATVGGEGAEVRVVGGAVRNALMGVPVADVDFATTATPDVVTRLAAAAHMKVVPTGVEHGTVTVICHGRPFEVTTLREDVVTDGRHAVVRFGRDWAADARRRDFTVNALSVDASGTIHDPIGGYADVLARRIRFIGNPDTRIAEDRLRILRFFRFNAEHGAAPVDAAGLAATMRARETIRELSAERVGQEMRRLLVAPRATEMAGLMQDAGILPVVLGGIGTIGTLARFGSIQTATGPDATFALRLAALACRIEEDVARVTPRLRLANAERDRILAALAAARDLARVLGERGARLALYRFGAGAYRDGSMLAWAWGADPVDAPRWRDLTALPDRWAAPKFPLSGRDVLGQGTPPSPQIGELLRRVEAWWIERDFAPDAAALRRRLQQMMTDQ